MTRRWKLLAQDEVLAAWRRLTDRYPRNARPGQLCSPYWPQHPSSAGDDVSGAIATGDRPRAWQHPALYLRADAPGPLTAEDLADALTVSADATADRLQVERNLIEMARQRGLSWAQIARATGRPDGRAVQSYYRWILGQIGEDVIRRLEAS